MTDILYKKVKKVLWIILFANFAVAFIKIVIGLIIKSTSMTADGYHSLTDGSSNIVGLIGIALASKPVDEDHPYGHKKFETLTGLFIGAMLLLVSGKLIFDAKNRFLNPVVVTITAPSLIMLIITLLINIFVCIYEYKKGKELCSQILVSDSMHTKSDIFVSIGVLFSLICIKMGLPEILDPIASLVVAGFILYASFEIFKVNSDILVDKVAVDTNRIKTIVLSFDKVLDTHDIRSRGFENDIQIDLHILTEPHLSVEESHTLNHNIEDKIKEEIQKNIQLIVHFEPYN